MADSLTLTYDFVLPEVNASDDTWGTKLNANLTQLDMLLRGAFEGGDPGDLGKLKPTAAPESIGELVIGPAGIHIRMKQNVSNANGYGTLLYSDATNFEIRLTNNNDADGIQNSLRPFVVRKADGLISMDNGLVIKGGTMQYRTDGLAGYRIMTADGSAERSFFFTDATDTIMRNVSGATLRLQADGQIRASLGHFAGDGSGLTNLEASALPTDAAANTWALGRALSNTSAANTVGSYALLFYTTPGVDNPPNTLRPGSAFQYANTEGGPPGGSSPGGTWRCMGDSPPTTQATRTCLWFRIN